MDLMEYVLNLQGEFTKGIEEHTKRLNELEIKLDKVIEYQLNQINKELDKVWIRLGNYIIIAVRNVAIHLIVLVMSIYIVIYVDLVISLRIQLLIDSVYGIISLISFMGIIGICGYIAIPKDIRDIKRIIKEIRE